MFEDLKRLLSDHIEIKLILAPMAIAISWVFNAEYEALIAIFSLRAIDFSTGTYWALKNKCWCSERSTKGAVKSGMYLILIIASRLADKILPVKFASPMMDTWIVVTELGSILENVYKLGYPVPLLLIEKLKKFQDKQN